MAMVVTQPCFGCKTKACAAICPTEAFREGEQMLYISPEDCTECDACVSTCPVEAIYQEDDVPAEWRSFIELNSEMSEVCPAVS